MRLCFDSRARSLGVCAGPAPSCVRSALVNRRLWSAASQCVRTFSSWLARRQGACVSQDGRLHQLVLRHVASIATRLVDVGRSESPALSRPVLCRIAKAPLCAAYRQELAQLPLAPARLHFLHSRCSEPYHDLFATSNGPCDYALIRALDPLASALARRPPVFGRRS